MLQISSLKMCPYLLSKGMTKTNAERQRVYRNREKIKEGSKYLKKQRGCQKKKL